MSDNQDTLHACGAIISAIAHMVITPWIFAAWLMVPDGWWTMPGTFSFGGLTIVSFILVSIAVKCRMERKISQSAGKDGAR